MACGWWFLSLHHQQLQQKVPFGMILGSTARSFSRTVSFTERQNETEQGLWFTSGRSTDRYPPTTICPTSTSDLSACKNPKYSNINSTPNRSTQMFSTPCACGHTLIPTTIKPLEPTPVTFRLSSEQSHPGVCAGQKVSLGSNVYSFSSSGLNVHVWTCKGDKL